MTNLNWAEMHDLGSMLAANKNNDMALKLYRMAVESADTDDERVKTEAAIASIKMRPLNHMSEEELDRYIAAIKAAAEANPNCLPYWINLATAYVNAGMGKEAKDAAMVAVTINSESADAFSMLSTACGMLGDYMDELKAIEEAARLDSSLSHVLAMCRAKMLGRGEIVDSIESICDGYDKRPRSLGDTQRKPLPGNICANGRWSLSSPSTVWVFEEQGLGDFFMYAQAFRWLRDSLSLPVIFVSKNPELREIARFVDGISGVSDIPCRPHKDDYIINGMDLIRYRNKWATGKPYLLIPRTVSETIVGYFNTYDGELITCDVCPVTIGAEITNLTGNPAFPFEHLRGCYGVTSWDLENLIYAKRRESYPGMYLGGVTTLDHYRNHKLTLLQLACIVQEAKAVITTDTMLSHLAGALGVNCVTMLSVVADWRWSWEWYGPNHKTVKQKVLMEWGNVVEEAVDLAVAMMEVQNESV